jgi:hypothetical protein
MSSNIKSGLGLTTLEKAKLRKTKIGTNGIMNCTIEELCHILDVSPQRAKEVHALSVFQSIPSIGVKFAHDLISLGYYSLSDIKHKTGVELINDLEVLTGAWIDPCVEDQCRLVVYYANDMICTKSWWDFTSERKEYRAKYGYPSTRPKKAWFELDKYQTPRI